MGGQVVVDFLKGLGAVVVIGVDDGEGPMDQTAGGHDGMTGAPGLGAPVGDGVSGGHIGQLLKGVFHRHVPGQAVADGGVKGVFQLRLNDEHHGFKARAAGVKDGVVDDQLTVRAHGVDLF